MKPILTLLLAGSTLLSSSALLAGQSMTSTENQIKRQLLALDRTQFQHLTFRIHQGSAVLTGTATPEAALMAERAVRETAGVREVVNLINFLPATGQQWLDQRPAAHPLLQRAARSSAAPMHVIVAGRPPVLPPLPIW
jgi:hypothetical protein